MIYGYVRIAARNGDTAAVADWLAAHPQSVNDADFDGTTLLFRCIQGRFAADPTNQEDQLELLRYLLSQGADPNRVCDLSDEMTPLYFAALQHSPNAQHLLACLLRAGANPNVKVDQAAPLAAAIDALLAVPSSSWILPVVASLLRYGASLDNCRATLSAEDLISREERSFPALATDDRCFQAAKTLIRGVRAAGSWKKYCRRRGPHRDILRLRSFVVRGRATTSDKWLAGTVRLKENGLVWNILSFWRDADDVEAITLGNGDVVRVYD